MIAVNGFLFIRRLVKYSALAGVFFFILIAAFLMTVASDLKEATNYALSGRHSLETAIDAARLQDWESVKRQAGQAREDFHDSLGIIDRLRNNRAIKHVPVIRMQVDDVDQLLKTGEILSRSLISVVPLFQGLQDIRSGAAGRNFSELSAEQKEAYIRHVFESEPELAGLRANLELSILNLDKIRRIGILFPVYSDIDDLKNQLQEVVGLLKRGSPLIKLLPVLSGYPQESRFLLVMQNNDELRPTGGFIGVYGLMNIKGGEIQTLETHDSYHIDMPASISDRWQLSPPETLAKYLKVEKWYLRDANWSPDWPQTAATIEKIYNGELAAVDIPTQSFTGVAAITPNLVANLIDLVGPIFVRGETYTAENFQPLLQYNVEVAYREQNISQWDRKDIVDELLDELKKRLFELPSDKWGDLFAIVDRAILERDIQMYFFQSDWQKYAKELGVSGEVKQAVGDYLLVVDANLAAFKSDAVVKKNITYNISEGRDGLEATVMLSYRHEGGFDWRTTRYRSYTRIYAPLGSRLVSISGIEEDTEDRNVSEDKTLNKSVFGFFFTVEPGSARTVTVKYKLPDYIYRQWQSNDYTLLVQKQAGRRTEGLTVGFYPYEGSGDNWIGDLKRDINFQFIKNER